METGNQHELRYTVTHADLASEVGVGEEDIFPEVLATSRVIGLMEVTAARQMRPLLGDGELSVGVGIDMKHFAPTPIDEEVRVVATYQGLDGKLHRFDLEVYDRAGKVAAGSHSRAIVDGTKITEGARGRMAKAES